MRPGIIFACEHHLVDEVYHWSDMGRSISKGTQLYQSRT